jgi:hypothetical protein
MPVPSYGAMPLSKMFCMTRILQVVSMIVIIGISANFISLIVSTGIEAPQEFVGALSIACIATLYVAVSIGFYWSEANLGLLVMTGVDSLLLIAFIVVAVTLGKPFSFVNCYAIGKTATQSAEAANAYAWTTSVSSNLNTMGSKLTLGAWAGTTKANCFETKTIWGLSIALWFVTSTLLPHDPC